jgi:hypothetical protein
VIQNDMTSPSAPHGQLHHESLRNEGISQLGMRSGTLVQNLLRSRIESKDTGHAIHDDAHRNHSAERISLAAETSGWALQWPPTWWWISTCGGGLPPILRECFLIIMSKCLKCQSRQRSQQRHVACSITTHQHEDAEQ